MILTLEDIRLLHAFKIAIPEDLLIDDRPEHTRRDEYCDRLMVEAPSVCPEWKCSICGNSFSLFDGTRTFTRNPDCFCPGMPQTVRITRAVREITKMAEEMC